MGVMSVCEVMSRDVTSARHNKVWPGNLPGVRDMEI